ncbi:hypothetical protein D3C78_1900870 [compost metagenome]
MLAVRRFSERNSNVPVHKAMAMLNSSGDCTSGGTRKTAPPAPSSVPKARYRALELVGPTKGLETMYTVAMAQ